MFSREEKIELVQLIRELLDPSHPRVAEAQQAVKDAQPLTQPKLFVRSIYHRWEFR